jgi:hypothetical protein
MNIAHLARNPRAMKALTGLSYQEFIDLVPLFKKAIIELKMSDPKRIRRVGAGIKGHLPTTEDKLFFTLVYYKTYPTFDVLGFWFGKSRGRSCDAIHFFTTVAEKALGHALVLPMRKIATVEEFMDAFPEVKDLFTRRYREAYGTSPERQAKPPHCIRAKRKRIQENTSSYPMRKSASAYFLPQNRDVVTTSARWTRDSSRNGYLRTSTYGLTLVFKDSPNSAATRM